MYAFLGLGIGMIIVAVILVAAVYVLTALATLRVLTCANYKNTWAAWIPFYNYYALGDVAAAGRPDMYMFGVKLPAILFKLWWVVQLLLVFIRIPFIGNLLGFAAAILGFGTVLKYIYAGFENKTVEEVQVLAYISGFITIIAPIKFLTYDKNLRVDMASVRAYTDAQDEAKAAAKNSTNAYSQPQQPYGQAPQQPYGQAPQQPYGQPQQPYGQAPQQASYAQPTEQAPYAQPTEQAPYAQPTEQAPQNQDVQ